MVSGKQTQCQEELEEVVTCSQSLCTEACVVSDWSDFTECSVTCGDGTQRRTRFLVSGNQTQCQEELEEVVTCSGEPCPEACVVSDWSDFTECSVTCGDGTQRRTRSLVSGNQTQCQE